MYARMHNLAQRFQDWKDSVWTTERYGYNEKTMIYIKKMILDQMTTAIRC